MKKDSKKKTSNILNNKGTTLVEMIVTFALIAIFLTACAMVISLITNMYYVIKSETYAKQVSDILIEKISSEIEGAKYSEWDESLNPIVGDGTTNNSGAYMILYDKTDTKVKLYSEDGYFSIYYYAIDDKVEPSNSRKATIWKYSPEMYNGYKITDLQFIRGNAIGGAGSSAALTNYGITNASGYNDNVVLILLTINSPKYGEYKTYRFAKMFYVPETVNSTPNP